MMTRGSRFSLVFISFTLLCCGCTIDEDYERHSAQFGEARTDMKRQIVQLASRPLPVYFGGVQSEAGIAYSKHPSQVDLLLTVDQLLRKKSFERTSIYVAISEQPIKHKIIVASAFQGMQAKDASYVICGLIESKDTPIYFYTTLNSAQLDHLDDLLRIVQEKTK